MEQLEADMASKCQRSFLALTSDVSRMMNSEVTDFKRICVLSRLAHPVIYESPYSALKTISEVDLKGKAAFFSVIKKNPEGSLLCIF